MPGEKKTPLPADLAEQPVPDQIKWYYEHGYGSIQDYARIYRLSVEEVLTILDMTDMTSVTTQGDLVDQADLMPGTPMNYGDQHRVKYSTD